MRRAHLLVTVLSGGAVTYTISGTVYDADGTTAVEGATVALGALTATSAANGTYTIADVPAGTSGSMTCTKTNYEWSSISVAAMSGNLTSQNFVNAWYRAKGAPTPIAAYRAIGAASQAASYLNLIPGAHDKFLGVAPTWDTVNGLKYDITQYLKSDLVPASGWSFLARISNAPAPNNDNMALGEFTPGDKSFGFSPSRTAGVYYYQGGANSKAPAATSGVFGVLGNKGYRNGVAEPSLIIGGWGGTTTNAIYFGGFNNNGTPIANIAVHEQAEVFWDENHTPTEEQFLAVSAAMAALTNP